MYDVWYLDDGQILCHPDHVAVVLSLLDEALEEIGARRACQQQVPEGDIKTTVRNFGPQADQHTQTLLNDDRVTKGARVRSGAGAPGKILGGALGGAGHATVEFRRRLETVKEQHMTVLDLHNGQSAMTLIASCLASNKAVFLSG